MLVHVLGCRICSGLLPTATLDAWASYLWVKQSAVVLVMFEFPGWGKHLQEAAPVQMALSGLSVAINFECPRISCGE
jgi:hypothetical protein